LRRPPPKSSLDWTVILKALADESRLQIIRELLKNDSSVTSLSNALSIKIYNISRHLKILETSGLVCKRKEGNSRIYSISEELMDRFSQKDQILDLGCCKFTFKEMDR
jgi:ArsR family transcriptional regulator